MKLSQLVRWLLALALALTPPAVAAGAPFIVKPYLQLGGATSARAPLDLVWHAPDNDNVWSVEVQVDGGGWRLVAPPCWSRVAVPTVAPHRVYQATLAGPAPGQAFRYRVRLAGRVRFEARARARPAPGQPQRLALVGDLAHNGAGPRAMAHRIYLSRPDLLVLAGDLVYEDGRIGEYRRWFYPVYNADAPGPDRGAPVLREIPTVGVIGNHDVGDRGPRHPVAVDPDSFAYYLYWDQPGNGPRGAPGPVLAPARDWSWQAFLDAAGTRFPAAGTFSFDSGDVHITALDSNAYMHWEDPALRAWLARDLEAARNAAWRLVVFHHPPFNPDRRYQEMWMAQLWPLFRRHGVDLVLTGHVHSYQRTRPIRFEPAPGALAALDPRTQTGELKGELAVDMDFDGERRTRPQGLIQVISGAGGSPLHYRGKAIRYAHLRPFVDVLQLDSHSFSLMEIDAKRLVFRQVGVDGRDLDRFVLER